MGYSDNRVWSDRHMPQIKRIVGPYLLDPPEYEQYDWLEGTDLIVLKAKDMRISCRVRRPKYLPKYAGQFTMRSRLDSGTKTELAKVYEGFGDWMFYGFALRDDAPGIGRWSLIDLDAFRAHMIRDSGDNRVVRFRPEIPNGDGTYFTAFDIESFPADPPLIIARSIPAPQPVPISL